MKRNVMLLAMCQALMLSGTSLLLATSALVGTRLTDRVELVTLPLSLQYIGMMLASFSASMVMKHIGRKAGFQVGLLLALAGVSIAGMSIYQGSLMGYGLGVFLMGVFNGFGGYYRFTATEVAPPEFKARAISYVLLGGVIAAFIGPNLASLTRDLMPDHEFAGSYFSLIAIYLISMVLISRTTIPKPSVEERRSGGRPIRQIIAQPVFFVAVFGAMIGYGVMNIVMAVTPLAMESCGFNFGDTAQVIQWHVVGMFLPSFFTGRLIERFGVLRVMMAGALILLLCLAINLHGITYLHFVSALIFLGIGWNFLFIGGTTLLTEAYSPSEKAKTQGLNDFIIATTITCTSLLSGYLNLTFGWTVLNAAAIPAVFLAFVAVAWLHYTRQSRQVPA